MNTELNEAAENYATKDFPNKSSWEFHTQYESFKAGAQWQAEQKQIPTDEEIDKLAEKEYPIDNKASCDDKYTQTERQEAFIKGFKSALQYSVGDGWIDVKDGLPENKQIVNCFGVCSIHDKGGKVYRAKFYKADEHNKEGWIYGPVEVKNVTHWQPLPSPPINK